MSIRVLNFLLADHVYQDVGSGKFVLAGIFRQLNVLSLPIVYQRTFGAFVSLLGLEGDCTLGIEFIHARSQEVLLRTHNLSISSESPDLPIDFALEIPPIPIKEAGPHAFAIHVNGQSVGVFPLEIYQVSFP
jgi:hypothetical protein